MSLKTVANDALIRDGNVGPPFARRRGDIVLEPQSLSPSRKLRCTRSEAPCNRHVGVAVTAKCRCRGNPDRTRRRTGKVSKWSLVTFGNADVLYSSLFVQIGPRKEILKMRFESVTKETHKLRPMGVR
jgi:hypothetical protein